jgi:NAD(P)-dependent dehydrogenase (short-subunit alcohol dehydrogenase family)
MEIKGTVSVVTGGTRGIGKATALKLAELGSDIAIIYNTRDDLAKEVQSEIGLTQAFAAEFTSKRYPGKCRCSRTCLHPDFC